MLLYIIISLMKRVTFSQLRNNAKKYFDLVERGENIEVFRHGKLIAVLAQPPTHDTSRWKVANPLELNGAALSKAILDDRSSSRSSSGGSKR
jgi:antitoxin (DNA-binding transcriptional repressor) of toxin-antitoxin stability system